MIVRLKCFLSLVALSVLSISSFAAPPSGTVITDFTTENAPVWDFNGSYQITQQILGAGDELVDVTFAVNIVADDKGNVTGSGTTVVFIGSDGVVGGEYTVKGKVTGSDGFAR